MAELLCPSVSSHRAPRCVSDHCRQVETRGHMEDQNLEYVGFWPRVLASIIDTILVCVVTFPLLRMIYGSAYFAQSTKHWFAGPAAFLISWIFPAVAVILFWLEREATPGKMAIGARVVDAETGKALSIGQAIGRYLGYFASVIPCFLGVIWVAFDPRRQGWHDKLAGSVVVRPKNRDAQAVKFRKG